MADLLDMDYINGLPHPFMGRMLGGAWWPIHDFEVQTGLVRIDVCGKLDVKHIGDFTAFRDGRGVERSSEAFYADANEEERAPIAGVKERCPLCLGTGRMQVLVDGKHFEQPCTCGVGGNDGR